MNQNFTNWANSIEWEAVGRILTAHTLKMKGRRRWGGSEGRLAAGFEPKDIAQEVITKHLEKHCSDPMHNLTQDQLIQRLCKDVVNKLSDLAELHCNKLGTESLDGKEESFPVELDATFDQNGFDLDVLEVLDAEPELFELYSDIYEIGLKPMEVRKKREISEQEYQNRIRKIRRRIEPILIKHNLNGKHRRGSKTNDPSAERVRQ
jgi:hypothetical protein